MVLYLPFFVAAGSAACSASAPLPLEAEMGRSSTSPGAIVKDKSCVWKGEKKVKKQGGLTTDVASVI